MRGYGKVTDVVVAQYLLGKAFKGHIAFRLERVHRYIPAALTGMDHLVIPVSAFDQTNGDRQGVFT